MATTEVTPCVVCKALVPSADVSLTSAGWRCRECSAQKQLEARRREDAQVGQRGLNEMQRRASNLEGTLVVTVLITVASFAVLASGFVNSRDTAKVVGAMLFGLASTIYEFVEWRKAKRAVAILQDRESASLKPSSE